MLGNRPLLSAGAAVGRRLSSGESAKTFTGFLQTQEKQFLSDLFAKWRNTAGEFGRTRFLSLCALQDQRRKNQQVCDVIINGLVGNFRRCLILLLSQSSLRRQTGRFWQSASRKYLFKYLQTISRTI